jgi:hypothetical protein
VELGFELVAAVVLTISDRCGATLLAGWGDHPSYQPVSVSNAVCSSSKHIKFCVLPLLPAGRRWPDRRRQRNVPLLEKFGE